MAFTITLDSYVWNSYYSKYSAVITYTGLAKGEDADQWYYEATRAKPAGGDWIGPRRATGAGQFYTLSGASLYLDPETTYEHYIAVTEDIGDGIQTSNTIEFTTPAAPAASKPTTPSPANGATEEDFSALGLSWVDGGGADTFNVYMGPSGSLSLISSAQAGTTLTVDMEDVPLEQVIYWRVDATNDEGTTEGDTWHFDARPAKVSTFTPANEATGLTLDATTGTWESPSDNTLSYDVKYGTLSGFLSQVENTAELESVLTPNNYSQYGEIYYWRVDAVNDFGTTQGDELYFTTLVFAPPTPPGITWTDPGNDPAFTGTPTGGNAIISVRRLVVAANNKIWVEDL